MKPVEIIQYLIGNNSKQKDIVLDTFLWSWSTLIAAEKLWRVCYWMELDPVYIQVVIKRYHKYTKWKKDIKCLNREIDLTQIYEGA
jgi:site-specific DNA-methyltransferase (adenine-specific)